MNKLFALVSTVLCLHWRYLAVLVSYGCDIVIYVLFLNSHIVLNRKFSQIKYTIRLVRFGQFGLPVAVRPRWPVGSISSMFYSNHSPKMHRCKLGAWDRNVRGLGQILHDQLHWLDVPDRVLFKLPGEGEAKNFWDNPPTFDTSHTAHHHFLSFATLIIHLP